MQKLTISLIGLALAAHSYALTTQEIVAKIKPSIVSIKMLNSKNPDTAVYGTGFFIDSNHIMTAEHIVNGDFDKIGVYHLNGNQVSVESKATYENSYKSVDIAILQTKQSNHPSLTFVATFPERAVEFGFLKCHVLFVALNWLQHSSSRVR